MFINTHYIIYYYNCKDHQHFRKHNINKTAKPDSLWACLVLWHIVNVYYWWGDDKNKIWEVTVTSTVSVNRSLLQKMSLLLFQYSQHLEPEYENVLNFPSHQVFFLFNWRLALISFFKYMLNNKCKILLIVICSFSVLFLKVVNTIKKKVMMKTEKD